MPPMCGADISEVRGKLLLYVELKGNNLKVDSKLLLKVYMPI